jgi:uncharacterized protein involved in exopolysaccharide biosynthesis
VQAKVAELKKQLTQIEGSIRSGANTKSLGNRNVPSDESEKKLFYIPLSQVPDLGMELVRLLREVKIQETVFELLTQQYELAKVNEVKDMQTIQILDSAKVPDKKAKPKRMLIVFTTAVLSFLIALLLAFLRQKFDRLEVGEKTRWTNVFRVLRSDVLFWKKTG